MDNDEEHANGMQDKTSEDGVPKEGYATSLDDNALLDESTKLAGEEKILAAGRLLPKVTDKELLSESHQKILKHAGDCEKSIDDLRVDPSGGGWEYLGKTAGSFTKEKEDGVLVGGLFLPSTVYYKIGESCQLDLRIETPIAESLLIPLLSVLNETDLFTEWIPSWKTPRLGFRSVETVQKAGLASRIIRVITDTPWPLASRELFLNILAIDDIDHDGFCGIKLRSLPKDHNEPGVPPPVPEFTPVNFDGIFLFEACPSNHQLLDDAQEMVDAIDEAMILVTFKMCSKANIKFLPQDLINFVIKTVIGRIWVKLLTVAQRVKDGEMPQHKAAIENKREFYEWMEGRIRQMLQYLKSKEVSKEN
mmetsp:Transcript_9288/g.14302  ORF Transcript_9288/g.14302 Transcript_9288/m.14302 type:complete len:363 (-) Transcript_9288:113-1201(-)